MREQWHYSVNGGNVNDATLYLSLSPQWSKGAIIYKAIICVNQVLDPKSILCHNVIDTKNDLA